MRQIMMRQMRMAAFAVAVMVVLSGFALARDHDGDADDYNRGPAQARQYGYQNGYRDGLSHGREEAREHDPGDWRSADWNRASNGYQRWMGPFPLFQEGYRDGYQQGYRAAFAAWGDRWGNGSYYGRPAAYPVWGRSPAYDIGYQDGVWAANHDERQGKPFNPYPRGDSAGRDHGYSREYGDINAYRAQYSNGYRAGYESSFRRY